MNLFISVQRVAKELFKQEYEGYQRILEHLRTYTLEELEYMELEAKFDLERNERKIQVINAIPIMVSFFSMCVTVGSELFREDAMGMIKLLCCILCILIVINLCYILITETNSKLFARKKRMIEIIQKVKEEKIEERNTSTEEVKYYVTIKKC